MRRSLFLLSIILILGPLVSGSGLGSAMVSSVAAEGTRAILSSKFALTGALPESEPHAGEDSSLQRSSCAVVHGEVRSSRLAECESTQTCSVCTLCQACHQVALVKEITQLFAFSPTQAPTLHIATVFSGLDRSPHFKPPIL